MIDMGKSGTELTEELLELRARLVDLSHGDLVERVQFLQSLIDAIPNPIFYRDPGGRYIGCNNAFALGVLGLPKDEVIGKTSSELTGSIPNELVDVYRRYDVAMLGTRGSQIYQTTVQFADGSRRQVLLNNALLTGLSGEVTGIVGLMFDLTDILEHEAERDASLGDAQWRVSRTQTAAEVSRAATSLLSLDELLPQSAELIRDRFDLYYVGVFLLDDRADWAVLRAGTGEAGARMLATGHRLRMGSSSMVGQCVATGQARISLDVVDAEARYENPILPETRSEMALPLVSRNHVIGAMTIQSRVAGAFSDDDITVLQTMADQLANAIQNALLFEQMDRTVRENRTLYNISAGLGDARSIEDFVPVALDVASFLDMDGASLRLFTRWDEDNLPLAMDVYGLSRRSGEPVATRDSGASFSDEVYRWFFADPERTFVYEDLADPAGEMPSETCESMLKQGDRSMIAAPLVIRGQNRGVLTLSGPQPLSSLAADAVPVFVRTLFDQVASALDRQSLVGELERRASYLATASEISRAMSSYLDQDQLLSQSVELIFRRLGFHFVGVLLLDDSSQWALLKAGSGPTGQRMMVDGYRLPVDDVSAVGRCIVQRNIVKALKSGDTVQLLGAGYLPSAHFEVALPLIGQGEILGAMVVQLCQGERLSPDDIITLTTLADQLANSVVNAQLYEKSQLNIDELQQLQQRYAVDMWEEYRDRQDVVGYSYDLNQVTPLMAFEHLDLPLGGERKGPVIETGVEGGDGAALMQILEIRGEPVGLMSFEEPGAMVDWSEDQVTVLEAVREQLELALENRLLIDRSQRALHDAQQREAELGFLQEVSALLNATNDVVSSRVDLFTHLKDFVSLNQLTLVGHESEPEGAAEQGRLTYLGGEGVGCEIYDRGPDQMGLADSGFAWAVANQSVSVEEDLRLNPRFPEDDALAAAGVLSRLVLPLRLGQRTLGAMELGSARVGVFARAGLMPIPQQVASQVASAIERGNLLQVAQASAEESRLLYEATSDLAEAVDASDILQVVARHAFSDAAVRAEIGLYVVDPETGAEQEWLEIAASLSTAQDVPPAHAGTRLRASEIPALALLSEAQIFVCEDVATDPRISQDVRDTYLVDGVRAIVVASLSTGVGAMERIGVLRMRFREPYAMSEEDLRLYHTVSDQAAVVLSNRRLFQESQSRIVRQAAAVELANLTTALSERESLLQESVDFLVDRFDLYFAGIFLTDELGEWAVLRAGTGDAGGRLMLMGHRVQVGGGSMVGRCIQRRSRILSMDIDRASAMIENPLLPDTRSAVVFPLISRGQTHGVITLQNVQRFAFTQEDVATLELMVNQLANVIESTNLYERSQESLAETRMLYRIAQQITDARDAESVLRAAVDGISQRSEPDWVTAALLEPCETPTQLRIAVSWSREGRRFPREAFSLDQIRQFYDALRVDERFVTPNIGQDPVVGEMLRTTCSELGLRATAAFQLRVHEVQYGTIMVHSRNARDFSTAEISFYENVARQASVALENISLGDVTREQAERRDILNQVLQIASSSLNETTILIDVARVISERLNMPLLVWGWDGVSPVTISAHDAGGQLLAGEGDTFRVERRLTERIQDAMFSREPVDLHFSGHGGVIGLRQKFGSPLVEGYGVLLMSRDVVYGFMVLGRQIGHDAIDDLEREFMRTAGANVGVALETASLYRDAQETAEKLKEVDHLKNQFMANMSHELRTPLNSIIGFSRVMIKGIDGPLTEMQQTDLTAIYESGRHLLNLLNDILDISKINAGKMDVLFESTDLKEMIPSVMSTAMGFVKGKPIKLMTDVPEDLPTVVADTRRIRQVLTNLLGNAGKFTEEGFIKISATYDDFQVIVSVQDTGIGIPTERLHAVFEQFEQVDSSSTRRYQGTGLGIPLSREFVQLHGGDIWIQHTAVGEGTTFSFSLPIGGPDSVIDGAVQGSSGRSRVVLTVDDDVSVITLFRRYLERRGYRVFGLTRDDRVVEEAIRLKPYAITLDVIMPGRDGWSVMQELKSNPETRDIPIIICSVLGNEDKGLSMGVADYLRKPISETLLLDALDRIGDEGNGGHVLVVDDNPDDRKLLRRILESAQYHVVEASGGAEAIDKITDELPSLVVLDLMMPDVDGFAVLEHLKRDRITRGIPVVVVTAKELGEEDRARLQQRTEALLQKGLFDQQQLLTDVAAALDRIAVGRA